MNARDAKKLAAAILACESVDCIVAMQVDGANCFLEGMKTADKKKVVDAAGEIAQELHRRAGDAVEYVVGDRSIPESWKGE